MLSQIEGSQAVARTVARCRPEVVCAYPISPQTHIIEAIGALVKSGRAGPCEFINVESEFAAMSVAIGASATGARAYTATASQGLLFMMEAVYNAAGLGLPIVMTLANRAIGAPINIWNDHSDAMALRDAGWVQLFAETNQEAVDLHVLAFRLAEELSVPVMVCMDGFILTHAVERVDVPTRRRSTSFLPPYEPRQVLDPDDPCRSVPWSGPRRSTEVRYLAHSAQLEALEGHPGAGRRVRRPCRPASRRPGQPLPHRGRRDGGGGHGFRARHHPGRGRRAPRPRGAVGVRGGRLVPAVPGGGHARRAWPAPDGWSWSRRPSARDSAGSCRPTSPWRCGSAGPGCTPSSPGWAVGRSRGARCVRCSSDAHRERLETPMFLDLDRGLVDAERDRMAADPAFGPAGGERPAGPSVAVACRDR